MINRMGVARAGVVAVVLAMLRPAMGENAPSDYVTLVKDGVALMSIVAGSLKEPVDYLKRYLDRITGAEFPIVSAHEGAIGIHVGLDSDFPWLGLNLSHLGQEGFFLKSDGKNLFMIAHGPAGVHNAAATFLQQQGMRHFFPGKVWEVVPLKNLIRGKWAEQQTPTYSHSRSIGYGFGTYGRCAQELRDWQANNRLGGRGIGGGSHNAAFLELAKSKLGKDVIAAERTKRNVGFSKLCYTTPGLDKLAIDYALESVAAGGGWGIMPTDGGEGFCECDRCIQFATKGSGKTFKAHAIMFGTQPDGTVVSVTSETYYALINKVAAALAQKYPDRRWGVRVYSSYTHPPSFDMHPSLDISMSSDFRRTPLSMEEQIAAWHKKTKLERGMHQYLSSMQFDWDLPDFPRWGPANPYWEQGILKLWSKYGITAYSAEASNNWGPRGLGYYVLAQLLWCVDANVDSLLQDFYENAFGPAAKVMERYFSRWYGFDKPEGRSAPQGKVRLSEYNVENLKASYLDLDEAANMTRHIPDVFARVNHLRMYWHFLYLRDAGNFKITRNNPDQGKGASFAPRLTYTNMIHVRGMEKMGMINGQVSEPPTPEEVEEFWKEDMAALRLSFRKESDPKPAPAAVNESKPVPAAATSGSIYSKEFRSAGAPESKPVTGNPNSPFSQSKLGGNEPKKEEK